MDDGDEELFSVELQPPPLPSGVVCVDEATFPLSTEGYENTIDYLDIPMI